MTNIKQVSRKLNIDYNVLKKAKRSLIPSGKDETCQPQKLPRGPYGRSDFSLKLTLKDAKFQFANTDSRLIESDSSDSEEEDTAMTYKGLSSFKLKKDLNLKKSQISDSRKREDKGEATNSMASTNDQSI